MEFNFNLENILPGQISVIESKDSHPILRIYDVKSCIDNNNKNDRNWFCDLSTNVIRDSNIRNKKDELEDIIDQLGCASAKAQELNSPITTFKKLLDSSQQKLYAIRDINSNSVLGILKMGLKRLFICDDIGAHHEVDATCVLDFYIHESKQRCGYGHELFELMLRVENIEPSKLAIDRPSFKFLSFLNKHYGLSDPKPQANNFVVYSNFFYDTSGSQIHNEKRSKSSLESYNAVESLNTLQPVPVPTVKDKLFQSSSGNCHPESNMNDGLYSYYRKRRSSNANSTNTNSPYMHKSEQNWGVYDALHSYSSMGENSNAGGENCTPLCTSLTPVNNGNICPQKKWDQLQSSWNVLGVKTPDYSMH